jgi:23S rRNA U2552 (ribose-2'-O)-methylase RlmE/FtsJ
VLKVFTAEETDALVARAKARFDSVRLTRPEATRKGSAELYLVGTGARPT